MDKLRKSIAAKYYAKPMTRRELDLFIAMLRDHAIRLRRAGQMVDAELRRLEARRKADGSKPDRTRRGVTKT